MAKPHIRLGRLGLWVCSTQDGFAAFGESPTDAYLHWRILIQRLVQMNGMGL